MRCPKCDCKESRLLPIGMLRGGIDSLSTSTLSQELLNLAASRKGEVDGSQVYCSWCGALVYEDSIDE